LLSEPFHGPVMRGWGAQKDDDFFRCIFDL
jgi:hypothetical protein